MAEQEEKKKPSSLKFTKPIFDFDLHPSKDLVITGLLSGRIYCHRHGLEGHQELWNNKPFKKSCRGIEIAPNASTIYSISKDKAICSLDLETGKTIRQKQDTHEHPLNALLCLNENMLATGDDQGVIKLWDTRKDKAVMEYREHEDFISQMLFREEKRTLLAVGGDGYLSTWDIRKPDVAAMSDHMEDELLSVALVKDGRNAVVGSQDGILSIWNWGDWGDYKTRFLGHPNSIETICKIDEDTICTGSGDGLIRVVSIMPNKFLGIIGDHGEEMPIENIQLTHDNKYMLSSGHDESLRFWDVGFLFEEGDDDEEEVEEKPTRKKNDFFASLAEDDDEETQTAQTNGDDNDSQDSDSEDDDEELALENDIEDLEEEDDDDEDSSDEDIEKKSNRQIKRQKKAHS
ncbi:hypothetical protein VTP01DRAFT_10486 [Rhizomucor pusillus]|uniref:uncharacterized protein n=1 Tax=Rhizomucor pusillus TaxID=4840 RepID=UPI003743BB44